MVGSISITSQRAVIGIKSSSARLTVKQPRSHDFTVQTKPARFSMNTQLPRIRIDSSQSFASMGIVPNLQLTLQNARQAFSMASEGISRMVSNGDYIGNIEEGGNRVAQIAAQAGHFPVDFSNVFGPYAPPSVSFDRQDPNLQWDPHQISMNYMQTPTQLEYSPYSIEIYMAQWPSITISYNMPSLPLGNHLDTRV